MKKNKNSLRESAPYIYLITSFVVYLFCFIGLPILFFCFAVFEVDNSITTSIYSINWTIFGILVAIISIYLSFYQKISMFKMSRLCIFSGIGVLFGSFLVCIQLAATTIGVFSGNNTLYCSIVFSSLYFLSLLFLNVLVVILEILTSIIRAKFFGADHFGPKE